MQVMIRQQKLQGLVLSRRKTGEADRVVSFLTREHGIVRAVARGVRKIPSSRGGHLEPFTQVLVLLHTSRAGTYIGAVETQEYFSELKENTDAFEHARHITSLAATLLPEEDPHPRVHDVVWYSWRKLPTLSPRKQNQLESAAMLMILSEAGLLPSWQACEHCGRSIPADSVVLDPTGGWRCITCHHTFVGTRWSLPPRLFKVLRYVSARPEDALRVAITHEESEQLLASLRYFASGLVEQPAQAW